MLLQRKKMNKIIKFMGSRNIFISLEDFLDSRAAILRIKADGGFLIIERENRWEHDANF